MRKHNYVTILISCILMAGPVMADSLFEKAKKKEAKAKSLGGDFTVNDLYKLPKKIIKVHDLVTVKIHEVIKSKNRKDTKTSKDSSILAQVKKAFTLDTSFTERGDLYGARSDILTGALPEMELAGTKEFAGSVDIKDDVTFQATITCEVIKVLPNGNLVLEARKTTKQNKETQTILFTGTVRSVDVKDDNTVTSNRVHGANIEYIGKGPLSNNAKKGLLSKLFDIVFPL
ncbi:MAG: hypothetical protein COA79_16245 [Planctomycetota bacterium]|nr:MAG: hypothetical protein COA79_16245 [Planctomycetota bacterium]